MKNKYIKIDKKHSFEKIISNKLTENTVNWLIKNFLQPDSNIDSNAKIMIKAITQTNFDFFEAFAFTFKKAIFDLITSSTDKKYLNKYIFKIIEKCLLKLSNIEKEFLSKLNKISKNVIDLYLNNKTLKIQKLFRICVRIIYIIYDKKGYSNFKLIKFFQFIFFEILKFEDSFLTKKQKEKILSDFIEVNFNILQKKIDLLDFYMFFYQLLINQNEKGIELISKQSHDEYYENLLESIDKLFVYEMGLSTKNQINERSYIKLLHNLFNMFYSDVIVNN